MHAASVSAPWLILCRLASLALQQGERVPPAVLDRRDVVLSEGTRTHAGHNSRTVDGGTCEELGVPRGKVGVRE